MKYVFYIFLVATSFLIDTKLGTLRTYLDKVSTFWWSFFGNDKSGMRTTLQRNIQDVQVQLL